MDARKTGEHKTGKISPFGPSDEGFDIVMSKELNGR